VVLPAGSATAGGVQVGTGATYKPSIYSPGADQLAISTGGTGRLFVDASGNVGVGTTPDQRLTLLSSGSTTINIYGQGRAAAFSLGVNATGSQITEQNNLPLIFSTNNTERARIDSSGRLLVGLSTSVGGGAAIQSVSSAAQVFEGIASRDDVYGSFLYLTKSRGTIASPTIVSNNDIVGAVTYKAYSGTSYLETASIEVDIDGTPGSSAMPSRMRFLTSGASGGYVERMRIDSTGLMTLAGPGIKFPATQVASSDPNTLDDYEEGTWTPVVAGSSTAGTYTLSSNTSKYTKIGRYVFCSMSITFSAASGGTGTVKISGLPFNYAAGSISAGSIASDFLNTTASTSNGLTLFIDQGSQNSTMSLVLSIDNSAFEGVDISAISTSTRFYATLSYVV